MKRRDLMRLATATSVGALAGLGSSLYSTYTANAAGPTNKVGKWSGQAGWPLIPMHALLLGDGRVLTYGTDGSGVQTGYVIYDVWDPGVWNPGAGLGGSHLTLPNTTGTDLFCNAQIVLPQSGNALLIGGDTWDASRQTTSGPTIPNSDSLIFSPGQDTLTKEGVSMNRPRWYATPTILPNGDVYLQGGFGGGDRPELREAGNFKLLDGIDTSWLRTAYYPRNFVAPNGRIFGYADVDMYFVNPYAGGNGSLTRAGSMPLDGPNGVSSTEVMYAPGRIMRTGGGTNQIGETATTNEPSKNASAVIDINGTAPIYKRVPSMPVSLHWATATVIADGRVVVTGGSQLANQMSGVLRRALIWKPDTGSWTDGATSVSGRARLYHSIALLLPDASILVGGGGAPGPEKNTNAEIYYPPYLFTSSGAFAARPRITAGPSSLPIGQNQTFTLGVDSAAAIQRVTLIKAGSVTHSFNFEQRFMELSFTSTAGGLSVKAPASATLATPGYYLLFVIDNQGVPSIAKIVRC